MQRVKKGDEVIIRTGRDAGSRGVILEINPRKSRVLVEGINKVQRHKKSNAQDKGGIVSQEATLHISNVQPYCLSCESGVRVRIQSEGDNAGERVCASCGGVL